MRAWCIHSGVSPPGLALETRVVPPPIEGHVAVDVHAVALNHRDLLVVNGRVRGIPDGRIPCSDAAGTVVSVGPGVAGMQAGDRVMTTFAPGWTDGRLTRHAAATALGGINADGVLSERIVLPSHALVPIPDGWSFAEAATLPCAGLTAWHALFEERPMPAGGVVLTMGSGGVSCFALQFARRAGCTVIALSQDAGKFERLSALGASFTIDSSATPTWSEIVQDLSAGGADHVLEVGGQGTLSQSIRATRHGGTISLIGTLARSTPVDLTPILMRNICLQGIVAGSREMLSRMTATLVDGSIRPVIDRVLPFDDASAAFAYLGSGTHVGKVIVRVR